LTSKEIKEPSAGEGESKLPG